MKKLTIEHLSAYLPYGVRCVYQTGNGMGEHSSIIESIDLARPYSFGTAFWPMNDLKNCKLILRPLSDLTREITHNGETFVPLNKLVDPEGDDWENLRAVRYNNKMIRGYKSIHDELGDVLFISESNPLSLPYSMIIALHSLHFDTFGLIETDLAIDINTLSNE